METQEIERILKDALKLDEVYVQGENAHYGVIAVSDEFAGLSRVKQQQLIYAPLMTHISSNAIHALTIKTYTVEKWKRERLLNQPS
ncbi:TPA: BolA family transcriptional regulator [Pasteurella multocida]|uniref:BolA family protein n=1 Tax=Pasteurella multocida TaxID=747 RepID=UPI0020233076|nr:BolA family protein [Pasteurella multocida]URH81345.1 BolA family transcriptional regulator [Pasteurella multocida]HDR1193639.1 BolA family transcriptional regulator [Pasteurella multocida]HDR1252148.1 BolA family transcriptional regulator [Pasteurella multocida]HDR1263059.1 BolA family transcriptional regulator [Pasteurella multocida]HDR1264958.1 BolA family transcriptional regulator [Pasteurella multocida]